MGAGHRDDDALLVPGHVPRGAQAGFPGILGDVHRVAGGSAPDLAGTGESRDASRFEGERAQFVVHRVGDDDVVADGLRDVLRQHAEALGLGEPRVRTVVRATGAVTDASQDGLAVLGQLDDRVVRGIADQEVAGGQERDLAGESKLGVFPLRPLGQHAVGAQRALRGVPLDQLADQAAEPLRVALTGHARDQITLGVDDGKRRPGASRVLLPGEQLRVVEHRVRDVVALDRGFECFRVTLVLELRGMDADHDQFVAELLLQRAELVDHVQAVDAAERPEVEQDDAAAQIGQGQVAAGGVQPAATLELWGPDAERLIGHGS